MKAVLPVAAVVIGIIILLLGLGWSSLFPAGTGWTPEKNDQLSAVETKLKGVGFRLAEAKSNPQMHRGEGVPALQTKHDEIKKEYDALLAEFESARDRPANTGNTLKWVGIIIAIAGGAFVFVGQKES